MTGKVLTMVPFNPDAADMKKMAADWDKLVKVPSKQNLVDIKSNVKNSQFAQPLFEFSGACSGSWTSQANKFFYLCTHGTREGRCDMQSLWRYASQMGQVEQVLDMQQVRSPHHAALRNGDAWLQAAFDVLVYGHSPDDLYEEDLLCA